jgi:hypothetical protein
VRAQLLGPPKPRPPNSDSSSSSSSDDGSDDTSVSATGGTWAFPDFGDWDSDEESLRAPKDATPFRSESEVRRNQPAARQPRKRRRRGGDLVEPLLEWDKMDTVPLVAREDSVDGWIDLKAGAEKAKRRLESEQRLKESREKVDDSMKERLKQEVVQPYQQNWILWISIAIAMLAIAFKITGGFDAIPVIRVPDL